MTDRTGQQMAMETMAELEDAAQALMLIQHRDGTVSWHGTDSCMSTKLGLLRFVTILVEQKILQAPDCESTVKKQVPN